jgi:hypothetical protein
MAWNQSVPVEFQHALDRGFGFERIKIIIPSPAPATGGNHREQIFLGSSMTIVVYD